MPPTVTRLKKMCNKAVGNYAHAPEIVPGLLWNQKVSNKVVDTSISVIKFISECCKIQGMCERIVDTFFCILFGSWSV